MVAPKKQQQWECIKCTKPHQFTFGGNILCVTCDNRDCFMHYYTQNFVLEENEELCVRALEFCVVFYRKLRDIDACVEFSKILQPS